YIKIRIDNMDPLIGCKEAVHSRYIDIIFQDSTYCQSNYQETEAITEERIDCAFRMSKINSDSEELIGNTDENFKDYYDYLYGIFTIANEWYFIMYTTKKIYLSERYLIEINFKALNYTKLCKEMKTVMEIIVDC
ncbi:5845_t:CDS:2, partial [Dentiscutata heterogama]